MKSKRLYKYDYNTYNKKMFTSKPKRPILPNLLGNALALIAFVGFVFVVYELLIWEVLP
jgi:hypothetical protein